MSIVTNKRFPISKLNLSDAFAFTQEGKVKVNVDNETIGIEGDKLRVKFDVAGVFLKEFINSNGFTINPIEHKLSSTKKIIPFIYNGFGTLINDQATWTINDTGSITWNTVAPISGAIVLMGAVKN